MKSPAFISDLIQLASDILGTTRQWGGNRAEVPWKEIYDSRRAVDAALEKKHRSEDVTGDNRR